MTAFASGKYALQICDRCGRRVKYGKLSDQIVDRKRTGIMVCRECRDDDHPQLQVGRLRINDPQSLRQPLSEDQRLSRGQFGWRPVGPITFEPTIGGVEVQQ